MGWISTAGAFRRAWGQNVRQRAGRTCGAEVDSRRKKRQTRADVQRAAPLSLVRRWAALRPRRPPPARRARPQDAKSYCRDIVEFLRTLKASRDMTINEAKLVIAIEDPRARERRPAAQRVASAQARRRTAPAGGTAAGEVPLAAAAPQRASDGLLPIQGGERAAARREGAGGGALEEAGVEV
jgi:hypothetical protein